MRFLRARPGVSYLIPTSSAWNTHRSHSGHELSNVKKLISEGGRTESRSLIPGPLRSAFTTLDLPGSRGLGLIESGVIGGATQQKQVGRKAGPQELLLLTVEGCRATDALNLSPTPSLTRRLGACQPFREA